MHPNLNMNPHNCHTGSESFVYSRSVVQSLKERMAVEALVSRGLQNW